MAHVSIITMASEVARDAIVGWDEGDMVYVIGVGLTFYDGAAWQILARIADIPEA